MSQTTAPRPEAASGIETIDVKAVNASEARSHYAKREKIYAKRATGTFRNIKWIVMAVTLGIYYLLPWVRWDRGPSLPDQAVLVDVANGRIFIGPFEIWPQEFYYVTGLLVLGALGLFLMTAIAGRGWCGYTCPQTVWTDLMISVERFWQGDRNARIRLDKSPWSLDKIYKKVMTHISFLLVSLLTGGAFVLYFRDAPTLIAEFFTGTAPMIAYLFLGIFTATTYLLGGIAREQVCIYMCPWPRIQGAMFDKESLLVSYREARGEPRGPHKKNDSWDGRGDCIDCKACVAVCPMGIDIRDGAQLECIQCALCIDACNEIMAKVGRPPNLIAYETYDTVNAPADEIADKHFQNLKIVRPRTLIYAALMLIVGGTMVWAQLNRSVLDINVIADRDPLYVMLSDGGVRNGYVVKILNKQYDTRTYKLKPAGLPDADLKIVGFESGDAGIDVAPDDLRELRVFVIVPGKSVDSLKSTAVPFEFVITDQADGTTANRDATFRRPPL